MCSTHTNPKVPKVRPIRNQNLPNAIFGGANRIKPLGGSTPPHIHPVGRGKTLKRIR